jgi:hypothetical protein
VDINLPHPDRDVIDALAYSEAELRERVVTLEAESRALRALAESRGDDAETYRQMFVTALTPTSPKPVHT